jgi:hypothetical protein
LRILGPAPRFRGERVFVIVAESFPIQRRIHLATIAIAHRLDAEGATADDLSGALSEYAGGLGLEVRLVMHTRGRIVFVLRRPPRETADAG